MANQDAAKHESAQMMLGLTQGHLSQNLVQAAVANGIDPLNKTDLEIIAQWMFGRYRSTQVFPLGVLNEYATVHGYADWDSMDTVFPSWGFGIDKRLALYHDATIPGEVVVNPGVSVTWSDHSDNNNDIVNTLVPALPTFSATGLATTYPAVVFGTNQFLFLNDNATLDYKDTGMAIVAVMQINTLPTTFKNIISKSALTDQIEFALQIFSTGEIQLNISPNGTFGGTVNLDPNFTVTLGVPFIVEIEFNTRDTRIIINGTNFAYSNNVIFNGFSPFIYGDAVKDGAFALSVVNFLTETCTPTERAQLRMNLAKRFAVTAVPTPVIIPAFESFGQSNELGLAPTSAAPANLVGALLNTFIYNSTANATQQLQMGTNNLANNASSFGPEMESGRQWALMYGRRVMLIKQSQSGAHIADDDLANSYYPDGGALYTARLNNIHAAMAFERAAGREVEIMNMNMFQGEGDSIGMTASGEFYYLTYKPNLKLLIETSREDLALRGYARKEVPFLAILSAIDVPPYNVVVDGKPLITWVNDYTIEAVKEEPNARATPFLDRFQITEGLPVVGFISDNIHGNAGFQVAVGQRRATLDAGLL